MILIKPFEKEHLDDVVNIEKTCFSSPWNRADLASQLDNVCSHFYVAVDNGVVVGYMGVQIFSGEGYVTNVAVLPEYRRRGIAQRLIGEALKNDMEFLSLEVRKSNKAAIKLYNKMNFEAIGVRPRFYSNPDEDAVIMTIYKEKI